MLFPSVYPDLELNGNNTEPKSMPSVVLTDMSIAQETVLDRQQGLDLVFDPINDLLGSGKCGEVFKVQSCDGRNREFALKRFYDRIETHDFDNEINVLSTLAAAPHRNIAYHTSTWVGDDDTSYILFPLAKQDLRHLMLCDASNPGSMELLSWIIEQMLGVSSALSYIHEYIPPQTAAEKASKNKKKKRVGFHHDLKPANILLFDDNSGDIPPGSPGVTWKICDFGTGATRPGIDLDSQKVLYNRKLSRGGDANYNAPEAVIDGRASYPKDIWSLGCIFLEVLVWALAELPYSPISATSLSSSSSWENSDDDYGLGAVERFRRARQRFSGMMPNPRWAVYWCQDKNGNLLLNPAVKQEMDTLEAKCTLAGYKAILDLSKDMLSLCASTRPTAEIVHQTLQSIQKNLVVS